MADPPGLLDSGTPPPIPQVPQQQQQGGGGWFGGLLGGYNPAAAYSGNLADPATQQAFRQRALAAWSAALGQDAVTPYKSGILGFARALGRAGEAGFEAEDQMQASRLQAAQAELARQQGLLQQSNVDINRQLVNTYLNMPGGGDASATGLPGGAAAGGAFGNLGGAAAGKSNPNIIKNVLAIAQQRQLSPVATQALIAGGLGEGGFAEGWAPSQVKDAKSPTGLELSYGPWQLHQGGELGPYLKGGGRPGDIAAQTNYVIDRLEKITPGFSQMTDPQKAAAAVQAFERGTGGTSYYLAHFPTAGTLIAAAGGTGPPGAPAVAGGPSALPQVPDLVGRLAPPAAALPVPVTGSAEADRGMAAVNAMRARAAAARGISGGGGPVPPPPSAGGGGGLLGLIPSANAAPAAAGPPAPIPGPPAAATAPIPPRVPAGPQGAPPPTAPPSFLAGGAVGGGARPPAPLFAPQPPPLPSQNIPPPPQGLMTAPAPGPAPAPPGPPGALPAPPAGMPNIGAPTAAAQGPIAGTPTPEQIRWAKQVAGLSTLSGRQVPGWVQEWSTYDVKAAEAERDAQIKLRYTPEAVRSGAGISLGGAPPQFYAFGPPQRLQNPDGSFGMYYTAPPSPQYPQGQRVYIGPAEPSAEEKSRQTTHGGAIGATQPITIQNQTTQQGPGYSQPVQSKAGSIIPPASEAAPISGSKEYLDARAKQFADTEDAWGKSVQSANEAMQRTQAIMSAMRDYQTGAWAEEKSDLVAKLKVFGIDLGNAANDPAKAQEILKNSYTTGLAAMKATGLSKWTQAELFGQLKNFANPENQPAANREIGAETIGTLQWEQQMQKDFAEAKKYTSILDPQDFQRRWVDANPLQPYVDRARTEIGPLKGEEGGPQSGLGTPLQTLTGPNGHRIGQFQGRGWIDMSTGQPWSPPAAGAR